MCRFNMQKKIKTEAVASAVLCTALAMLLLASCNIYEDLNPCPHGINLRFVYDYNMEYANAFPSKVDNIILYIYDEQGNFLKSYSEAGEKLHDENYRLKIDLPHGKYRFVAYGGIAGEDRSFNPVINPVEGNTLTDLEIMMNNDNLINFDNIKFMSNESLHDFFYGALNVTVEGEMYHDATINLMCNTNNIRIMLQSLDGQPVPMEKFEFAVADDNTLFDAENNLVPNGTVTYLPWTIGESMRMESDEIEVKTGFAEFSTSRLSVNNDNQLIILRTEDNKEILKLPLNKCLLLLKSEKYAKMGAQEFLDRESDWSIIFLLDSKYNWIKTQIIINGWVVKLNNVDY